MDSRGRRFNALQMGTRTLGEPWPRPHRAAVSLGAAAILGRRRSALSRSRSPVSGKRVRELLTLCGSDRPGARPLFFSSRKEVYCSGSHLGFFHRMRVLYYRLCEEEEWSLTEAILPSNC